MKSSKIALCAAVFVAASLLPFGAHAQNNNKKNKNQAQPQNQPPPAPQGGQPRSAQSNVAARIVVKNFTGKPVQVVWIDLNGNPQNYGTVPPQFSGDAAFPLETFVGHLWVFKNDRRVLQTYTVTDGRKQVVVLGDPANAGLTQNPVVPPQPPPNAGGIPPVIIKNTPQPVIPGVVIGGGGGAQVPAGATAFLKVHNDARAKVGVQPLQWSAKLAAYTQQWADSLASSGTFKHRDNSAVGYGENIFTGSDGFTPADAANSWLEERSAYRGGPLTNANFATVGHYTQMVWSSTTQVGYGFARGRNGVVVVANYAPGGNFAGQKPY